jgi:plastocyanin
VRPQLLQRVALAAALLPALAGAAPPASQAEAGRVLSVAIEDMRFTPATLAARPGDRVVWTNRDLVPHTVTARDGRFDSKAIPANASFTWVATGVGRVDYACLYHPTMAATLTLP